MKITIEGSAKEITELVVLAQTRQDLNSGGFIENLIASLQDTEKAMSNKPEKLQN